MSETPPTTFGRYQLIHRLGQGGMGEVHLASLVGAGGFEKLYVLKTILPRMGADPQFVQRFQHEARLLVHLQHSNIAQVYDLGEVSGTLFMAMEYVPGVDLSRVLGRASQVGAPMPIPIALHIGQHVAEALGYAHRKVGPDGLSLGIVHRDVSPHNVMVSYEGETKVIDFGLAKSAAGSAHTLPSTVMGKLGYMSPEQARAEKLDHRSDIYSCGVVVWEMLAGRRLFDAESVGQMIAAMGRPNIPSVRSVRPEIPASLDKVVHRALAPEVNDRYARADDFARALNEEAIRWHERAGAEEVGTYLRDLCPEEFAEQRRLISTLSRRLPTAPDVHAADMAGTYVREGSGGAAVQATSSSTHGSGGTFSSGGTPSSGVQGGRGASASTGQSGGVATSAQSGGTAAFASSGTGGGVSASGATPANAHVPAASGASGVSPAPSSPSLPIATAVGSPAMTGAASNPPEARRQRATMLALVVVCGVLACALIAVLMTRSGKGAAPVSEPVARVEPAPHPAPSSRSNEVPSRGAEATARSNEAPARNADAPARGAEASAQEDAMPAESDEASAFYEVIEDGGQLYVRAGRLDGMRKGTEIQLVGSPGADGRRARFGKALVMEISGEHLSRLHADEAPPAGVKLFVPRAQPVTDDRGNRRRPVRATPAVAATPNAPAAAPVAATAQPAPAAVPAVAKSLKGRVVLGGIGPLKRLVIHNLETRPWTSCDLRLANNKQYRLAHLAAGDQESIALARFRQDGVELDTDLSWVDVKCAEGSARMSFSAN
ncbi:protein kinase [Myxococcaceae bacterium JPH2]|nr:protein kinase [Myxococcaceae bacterium JPH2]